MLAILPRMPLSAVFENTACSKAMPSASVTTAS